MIEINNDNILVFTDGSCINNGKLNAKAGIGIYFPNKEHDDISEPFNINPITNQRAELNAIYQALKLIVNNLRFQKITIYTDSLYSIKCLTLWIKNWNKNNWITSNKKPVKNIDIIRPIYNLMKEHENKIIFIHVKSHTNGVNFESKGNSIADELACKASLLSLKKN